MPLSLRAEIADGLICDKTCCRRKMTKDNLCDRVEMWQKQTENQPRRIAITKASYEIAEPAYVVIPAVFWKPGLPEILETKLCAIESAIDVLRSSNDKALFKEVLGDILIFYNNPLNWPIDLEDDHMNMVLAVLKHAMEACEQACEPDTLDSERDPHRCFGRVAGALEQVFLYRTRNLDDVSESTSGLFKSYEMIYKDAVLMLRYEMKRSRRSDEFQTPKPCGPMLGVLSNGDEGEDPSEANGQDKEVAVAPQNCGCRYLMWKFKQTNERRSQKIQDGQDRRYKRIAEGYNTCRTTTEPSVPSPLGQLIETSL